MAFVSRRQVKVPAVPASEVDQCQGGSQVAARLASTDVDAASLALLLENYINATSIQYARIEHAEYTLQDLLDRDPPRGDDAPMSFEQEFFFGLIFLDLHYLLICADKVRKLAGELLKRTAPLAQSHRHPDQVRSARRIAEARLRTAVSPLGKARNYMEHIEKEISSGNYSGMKGGREGGQVMLTLGGGTKEIQIKLGAFEGFGSAYQAVLEYVDLVASP
jgi:hypothetical protein